MSARGIRQKRTPARYSDHDDYPPKRARRGATSRRKVASSAVTDATHRGKPQRKDAAPTRSQSNEDQSKKRKNYIGWSDYFMAIAYLSAQRSKDPVTQVGACIVNEKNKIVGTGYNGMPRGCHDDLMPWGKGNKKDKTQNKHLYVCHAEMNAILNKNSADVENCTIYVTLFPCNECAKLIIQSGIKKVVYLSMKDPKRPEFIASKRMMNHANVEVCKFTTTIAPIQIDLGATGSSVAGGPPGDISPEKIK